MHVLLKPQDTENQQKVPTFSCGKKLNELTLAILWQICAQERGLSSRQVLMKAKVRCQFKGITVRHMNRLRACWDLSRSRGRPRGTWKKREESQAGELVHVKPVLEWVGIHLFHLFLEREGYFDSVVSALEQGIEEYRRTHEGEAFPLLYHKLSTLQSRFQALFYAPLFDIGKLTQYDVKEHALESIIGRNYQSSTLNQYLGQLERIDAAKYLLPVLTEGQEGSISYIDGHMIAFWTSRKLHKGKITMLGRIMAGSNTVVAHNESGQAIFLSYYSPDIRLNHVILDYCEKVVEATGIKVFVIDREVNSADMGRHFAACELGLLSMLDKNEYKGLVSFEVELLQKQEKRTLYEGKWADKEKAKKDRRHFVVEVTEDKVAVFWGTKVVKEQIEPVRWPEVYRRRNELQENSFKRMIAHGALNVNYGIKTIEGPDRHQARKKAKLEEEVTAAVEKKVKKVQLLEEQEKKVEESIEKNHGKRLEQRQNRLKDYQCELKKAEIKVAKKEAALTRCGEDVTRKDRDFRKQSIMTFRTLFLENLLRIFFGHLFVETAPNYSMETVLNLCFHRSGGYLETPLQCIYWLSSRGLSSTNKKIQAKLVHGLTGLKLVQNGKPIVICVRDGPY